MKLKQRSRNLASRAVKYDLGSFAAQLLGETRSHRLPTSIEVDPNGGYGQWLREVSSRSLLETPWDPAKHPRGGYSQNRGWWSPAPGSGGTNSIANLAAGDSRRRIGSVARASQTAVAPKVYGPALPPEPATTTTPRRRVVLMTRPGGGYTGGVTLNGSTQIQPRYAVLSEPERKEALEKALLAAAGYGGRSEATIAPAAGDARTTNFSGRIPVRRAEELPRILPLGWHSLKTFEPQLANGIPGRLPRRDFC
jgi:hypothetical protein